ncbi:ribosomal protein S18-alanine N-acetyltransferase [Propionivibrio sp.]|uniref:ribosomal protein S18-alanine N-acetyltransferase n=1 Tax=Propionivibrio sp. TaxID=2212460 RepID=UPI00263194FA|nr:ribosomal protein S18-alanine N-acetyltransferase [Propionivibrio sp.]
MDTALELGVVELLPMRQGDLDAVLAIECHVCSFPWGRINFTDSMACGYSCWVCRVDNVVVGYFVLMLAVDDAHLLTIGVAESHQRRGLGARLLRQAMVVGLAAGAKTLLLEVRPSNTKALAMYQHFGFGEIGVRRGYYPADGGREDALVLTHPLAEVSV